MKNDDDDDGEMRQKRIYDKIFHIYSMTDRMKYMQTRAAHMMHLYEEKLRV